jgi:hypothetical protein
MIELEKAILREIYLYRLKLIAKVVLWSSIGFIALHFVIKYW